MSVRINMAFMSKSACQVVSLIELLFCAFFVCYTLRVIEERLQSFLVSASEQAALHVMDVRRSGFLMDNRSLI